MTDIDLMMANMRRDAYYDMTFEKFLEGLDFTDGYCTFTKGFSYVRGGSAWSQPNYTYFMRFYKEFEKHGYHMIELNESNNMFRDTMVTYVYQPDRIGDFRMRKFGYNLPKYFCITVLVLFILLVFCLPLFL